MVYKTVKNTKNKGKIYVLNDQTYALNIRREPNPDDKGNIVGHMVCKLKPIAVHDGKEYTRPDGSVWIYVNVYNTAGLMNDRKTGWVNSSFLRRIN